MTLAFVGITWKISIREKPTCEPGEGVFQHRQQESIGC